MWLWSLFFLVLGTNAIHIPLYSTPSSPSNLRRRAQIGLGDFMDVTYSILVKVGDVLTPLVVDTGSSDLWVTSTACKSEQCKTSLPLYPQDRLKSTNIDVSMYYGDSRTGTHAIGPIGIETVSVAGLGAQNQYFGAIHDTNTTLLEMGETGIFGLGFPVNSFIWSKIFKAQHQMVAREEKPDVGRRDLGSSRRVPDLGSKHPRRAHPDHARSRHSSLSSLYPSIEARQADSNNVSPALRSWTQTIIASFATDGPLIPRLILSNGSTQISDPTFTVSLQRNTIAPPSQSQNESVGLLSIGEYPSGLTKDSFTWTTLRLYRPEEGGLYSPTLSPTHVYPISWEVPLEGVFLDGQALPPTNYTPSSISLSALIDTGNSLIRGPEDVVMEMRRRIGLKGGVFPCDAVHRLEFKIGGKLFPVDPRDFVSQAFPGNTKDCVANVVPTDSPKIGEGLLYSWSLGAPFLKSVIASYHYGNLTHPASDPPSIGLISTVPDDAGEKLKAAVTEAKGDLFGTSNAAPPSLPTEPSVSANKQNSVSSPTTPSGVLALSVSLALVMSIVFC